MRQINQSINQASKGSPPVRGAGYTILLLTPGDKQETPSQPHRSQQQTTTTEQEQLGPPSAVFIISTSNQSQSRRQNDTQAATPMTILVVNWLTYLPPT